MIGQQEARICRYPGTDWELTKRCPVYYGNGNHETRIDQELGRNFRMQYDIYVRIKGMGVRTFSNRTMEFRMISLSPESIWRNGIISSIRPSAAGGDWRLAGPAEREQFLILLCHSPLFSIPAGNGARIWHCPAIFMGEPYAFRIWAGS